MNEKSIQHNAESLESLIFTIRGQRVIMDADLAHIYGVPTKRLNEQVRRNADRFPDDFMFQLSGTRGYKLEVANCDFKFRGDLVANCDRFRPWWSAEASLCLH